LAKRALGSDWQRQILVVDGHNVHITVESAILGRPLLIANDGALRDLAGQSARFRHGDVTHEALQGIVAFLAQFRPQEVLFLFDAPMSHSGLLARHYRDALERHGVHGEARAVPVPERVMPFRETVVASSDQEVLDRAARWLDLARCVSEWSGFGGVAVDFTALRPGGQ
jgi:hypothetical protein